jgi:WhiB family redox-sensing transcriptional regulator
MARTFPRKGEWEDKALCAQVDPELFYPEPGDHGEAGKEVCRACPVRRECLRWSLLAREPWGTWGGLTENERRKLLRRPRRTHQAARAA